MFIDRVFSEKKHIEVACILCGVRKMADKEKNAFAAWLLKKEVEHANAITMSG